MKKPANAIKRGGPLHTAEEDEKMTIIVVTKKTKDDVMEAAKAMENINLELSNWGIMNEPVDIEKRIEARARAAIIRSILATATKEYENYFSQWERGGFQDTFDFVENSAIEQQRQTIRDGIG